MSASESNGYKWQTNINNDDDKTRVDIRWADHFLNKPRFILLMFLNNNFNLHIG
jgi:hypothetical protein